MKDYLVNPAVEDDPPYLVLQLPTLLFTPYRDPLVLFRLSALRYGIIFAKGFHWLLKAQRHRHDRE
jgi:hypothetical protein